MPENQGKLREKARNFQFYIDNTDLTINETAEEIAKFVRRICEDKENGNIK